MVNLPACLLFLFGNLSAKTRQAPGTGWRVCSVSSARAPACLPFQSFALF